MSNEYLYQLAGSKEPGLVVLTGEFTFAGTTLDAVKTRAKGMVSLARNADGKFTLTLSETYNRLLGIACVQKASAADTANVGFLPVQLESETVASSKTLVLRFWKLDSSATPAAVAAIPASGEKLFITLLLSNSSAF
jgi:hypothetical protein